MDSIPTTSHGTRCPVSPWRPFGAAIMRITFSVLKTVAIALRCQFQIFFKWYFLCNVLYNGYLMFYHRSFLCWMSDLYTTRVINDIWPEWMHPRYLFDSVSICSLCHHYISLCKNSKSSTGPIRLTFVRFVLLQVLLTFPCRNNKGDHLDFEGLTLATEIYEVYVTDVIFCLCPCLIMSLSAKPWVKLRNSSKITQK